MSGHELGGSLLFLRWVPAVDRYGGVLMPVCSHSFYKLDERAAGLWDSVLRPRGVVEVANQDVVAMLPRWKKGCSMHTYEYLITCSCYDEKA